LQFPRKYIALQTGVKALKDSHVESKAKASIQQIRMKINQANSDQLENEEKAHDFNI